jgi:hypothetical protein
VCAIENAGLDPDNDPCLSGQVITPLEITELLAEFQRAGLDAEIRYSSFYEIGCYLRVQDEKSALIFEKIEPEEYLVHGDADSLKELIALARSVSQMLCQSELRHRFELYDSQDQLVDYVHFNWSQHN